MLRLPSFQSVCLTLLMGCQCMALSLSVHLDMAWDAEALQVGDAKAFLFHLCQ